MKRFVPLVALVAALCAASAARAAVTTFSTRAGVINTPADSIAREQSRRRAEARADSVRAAARADSARNAQRVAALADSLRRDAERRQAAARAAAAPTTPAAPAKPVASAAPAPGPAKATPAAPAGPAPAAAKPTPAAPPSVSLPKPPVTLPVPVAGMPPAPAVTPPATATKPVASPPAATVAQKPVATATTPPAAVAPSAASPTGSKPVASRPATAPLAAGATPTTRTAPAGTTRVTYIAGTTAYLDAGRLDGLDVGDSVTVLREGAAIARLRIAVVSSRRAVCDTLSATGPELRVGDAVRFVPRPVAVATADTGTRVAAATRSSGRSVRRVRGRLGARWQNVSSEPADGSETYTLSQPAIDLRLDGHGLAGGHVDLAADVRSRTTTRSTSGSSTTESLSRVYRASAAVHDEKDRRRLTLGRQTSAVLSTISLFDGALAEWLGDRASVGAFSGMQPEPVRMGFSSDVIEHGAYVELHQRPRTERRWSTAIGVVTSLQAGQPNRDFAFAQASWMSKGLTAWWTQELDWNRGWKRDSGEVALSLTSTFLSVRVPLGERVAVNGGFDNRRSVRLYRDRETPETVFDDHYRQGAWVGASVQPLSKLRLSGDVRHNGGSPADRSDAWSASAELWRISSLQATMRARTSFYSGETQDTRLLSLGLGLDPRPAWHVELGGGTRATDDSFAGATEHETWTSGALDVSFARRWYLNGSIERNHGDSGTNWLQFAGLSVRF